MTFTIGLNVLEFFCHFSAMICYVLAGIAIEKGDHFCIPLLLVGITLTTIGAHL